MNQLTNNEIREILRIVEDSKFDILELTAGDLKIIANKHSATSSSMMPTELASASAPDERGTTSPVAASAPTELASAADPELASAVPAMLGKAEVSTDDTLQPIKSPIVGIFYATPEPDAPPFVEEGSTVDADSTVGLVEVMKVFSGVKAGIEGKVVKCLVGNGEFVEHGQVLFLVEPKAGGR